jgi:hypothetical protein
MTAVNDCSLMPEIITHFSIFNFVFVFSGALIGAVRIPGLKTGVSGSTHPLRQGAAFWTLPGSSARGVAGMLIATQREGSVFYEPQPVGVMSHN